jgi:hypothetical protein
MRHSEMSEEHNRCNSCTLESDCWAGKDYHYFLLILFILDSFYN